MAEFTASLTNITHNGATFEATFTGGDASYSRHRVCLLKVREFYSETYYVQENVLSEEVGGADSTFRYEFAGLPYANHLYWYEVKLGYSTENGWVYRDEYQGGGSFNTMPDQDETGVSPWSWTKSNGAATDVQTQAVYGVLQGIISTESFFHEVWNDIVRKTELLVEARNLEWDDYYATKDGTKAKRGDFLSAAIYNSVVRNLSNVATASGLGSLQLWRVNRDDSVTGYHIVKLTESINKIITSSQGR